MCNEAKLKEMSDSSKIVEDVMTALQQFYESGTQSGEDIFNEFAAKHASHFSTESSATGSENKLEWTQIYKEFGELFESHIESK